MMDYQSGGELRWKYHFVGGGQRLLKRGRPANISIIREKITDLEDDHCNERL